MTVKGSTVMISRKGPKGGVEWMDSVSTIWAPGSAGLV